MKRGVPVSTSVPTRPSSRPSTIMVNALSSEPEASATEATRPSTMSEKYSAGPNSSATLAKGGANKRQDHGGDGAGEERAQGGGRQRLAGAAVAWPSGSRRSRSPPRRISPGRLIRIAVVEPPYCAP